MVVYFGYTYCPDVCPEDLMTITQALDALGPAAEGVQPVFITIDPERDTKVLADYVSAFHRVRGAGKACSQFSSRSIRSGTPKCWLTPSRPSITSWSALPAPRTRFERSPTPTRHFT